MQIDWKNSIWFFDYDDTLVNTLEVQPQAAEAVYNYCVQKYDEQTARSIQQYFIDLYAVLFGGYVVKEEKEWKNIPGGRAAWNELVEKISRVQPQVIAHYGQPKKWSREIFAKFAADSISLNITPTEAAEIAEAYWRGIEQASTLYEDANVFIQHLRSHNLPIIIATSSDGRLHMNEDGTFVYNPAYSQECKTGRIQAMKEQGLEYDALSIGDPEDKPSVEFFQKAIHMAEAVENRARIEPANCIMVGDSFGGDLQTPLEQMNFGLTVLVDRTAQTTEIQKNAPRYITVNDLRQLISAE